ncbi:MAG: DUF2065 domain-containing protein [Thermodesulfobacteriota bacterium]
MEYFLSLIGMVMVVEGLTYALFPAGIKKVMVQILSMEDSSLSNIGKALMICGALLAWIVNI